MPSDDDTPTESWPVLTDFFTWGDEEPAPYLPRPVEPLHAASPALVAVVRRPAPRRPLHSVAPARPGRRGAGRRDGDQPGRVDSHRRKTRARYRAEQYRLTLCHSDHSCFCAPASGI